MKCLAKREFKNSGLKIVTSDGRIYVLPSLWSLSDAGSYSFRNTLEDKAFSHGGNITGDGLVSGRTIQVNFLMHGATEQEHDMALNKAYTFFCQSNYELYAGRADRKYRVSGVSKISHKYQKGFKQRWSEITVSLLLADPFRYEGGETKVTYDFPKDVENADMLVYNLGSVDTPLTFTFTPKGKMPSITVWHREAKEKFTVNDALLIAPSALKVSSKEGTVWRDNANSINTFSGIFLHAKPGLNLFRYTGGAGRIDITYTNRWFV